MRSEFLLSTAFIAAIFAAGCATAPAPRAQQKAAPKPETKTTSEARNIRPTPVKLMAWNLEHFVDPFDDPYIENQKEDDPEPKPDPVLRLLAEALKRADPDVLVVQEVESDRAFKLFLDSYLPGNPYHYYACVPAKEWYQNVVVVSKLPWAKSLPSAKWKSRTNSRTKRAAK